MKDIGKKLEQATESYTSAFGQLATGRGNLMRQAEELRELGIKPRKSLAISSLEEEEEEEN